jgi:hypothetical protein
VARQDDYSREWLLARFGDMLVPDLRIQVAIDAGARSRPNPSGIDGCGVIYPDAGR